MHDFLIFNNLIGSKYLRFLYIFSTIVIAVDFICASWFNCNVFFVQGNLLYNIFILAGSMFVLRLIVERYMIFFSFFIKLKQVVAKNLNISCQDLMSRLNLYKPPQLNFIRFDSFYFSWGVLFLYWCFSAYFVTIFIKVLFYNQFNAGVMPYGYLVHYGLSSITSSIIALIFQLIHLRVYTEIMLLASTVKLEMLVLWRESVE